MSESLYRQAQKVIPGGASRNTILRQPYPHYADFGQGCWLTDTEGNRRLDLANNMGSLIHGHAHPATVRAATRQIEKTTACTLATRVEVDLATLLCQRVPWFEKVQFMNSGTEAVMVAIKVARAVTGRTKVAKCEGGYHGTYDFAEVSQNASPENWGSFDRPNSIPVARGTSVSVLNDVAVIPFNDVERSVQRLDEQADEIAAVIVDPLPHRIGLIPASSEYMAALRDWTTRNRSLLIFDEVISFRMGLRGAADWYEAKPDLTTLGKIIGGGFPVGAVAGRDKFMRALDPACEPALVPWSGTFAANPVTMSAGLATLEGYDEAAVERLNRLGLLVRSRLRESIRRLEVKACVTGAGSMFRVHFKDKLPVDYRTSWQDDDQRQMTQALVDTLYRQGVMTWRTATGTLSTPMTESEVNTVAEKFGEALRSIAESTTASR